MACLLQPAKREIPSVGGASPVNNTELSMPKTAQAKRSACAWAVVNQQLIN
jgi:hypothetical protein